MKVDSAEEVDELKWVINSTLKYVKQHDEKELKELLSKIKEEVGEEYLDAMLELEGLVDVFLQDKSFWKMNLFYRSLMKLESS